MKHIITLYILVFFTVGLSFGQYSGLEGDEYNGFTARNFMKFNSFFTIPTFSVLHKNNQTIEAMVRSSYVGFEDAPRLQLLSYSGKMKSDKGAGVAVYQQEVGAFKDFGVIANYAHKIQMSGKSGLAVGFNAIYSNRNLHEDSDISKDEDVLISNFQAIPIVNLQPAVTYTYSDFEVGVFFENLVDFNLKESEMVTEFSDKTITAHLGYSKELSNTNGLLEDTNVRVLGVVRTAAEDGFSFGGNLLVDLPKVGWVKGGYDNLHGFNAGLGVNVSKRLSIGFSYEKSENLGGTNEVGVLYTLGKTRRTYSGTKPKVKVIIPQETEDAKTKEKAKIKQKVVQKPVKEAEYEDEEHHDLSDEIERAQDSINHLNKKLDDILKLLKNQPVPTINNSNTTKETTTIIKEVQVVEATPVPVESESDMPEELDTTLRRSTLTPWKDKEVVKSGGGAGSMYYVAIDQFKDLDKALALVKLYKTRYKIKLKYVRDPKSKAYYVYEERYAKEEEAERVKKEINVGGGFENDDNDLDIKVEKPKYKDPVYVVKITFGASGETYKVKKPKPKASIRNMESLGSIESAYYIVVNVFSKKSYAHKFVSELRSDGINANYFINPTTGYRHVYIYKTYDKEDLIQNYNNNLSGRYYDRMNLLHVR